MIIHVEKIFKELHCQKCGKQKLTEHLKNSTLFLVQVEDIEISDLWTEHQLAGWLLVFGPVYVFFYQKKKLNLSFFHIPEFYQI